MRSLDYEWESVFLNEMMSLLQVAWVGSEKFLFGFLLQPKNTDFPVFTVFKKFGILLSQFFVGTFLGEVSKFWKRKNAPKNSG